MPRNDEVPTPKKGMWVVDPAFPGAVWNVEQTPEQPFATAIIYLRRIRDGFLFHMDLAQWEWSFTHETLEVVDATK